MQLRSSFRTHHLTYASRDFSQAADWLAHTARKYGLGGTRVYSPADPVARDLAERFPHIMRQKKGGGYWLWKPHIIRDALGRAKEGDAVLYTDAGMIFVDDPAPLLALSREHPIVLFEHVPHVLQRHCTKRDCFVVLGADTPMHWDTPQLLSGFQLYRAGPEARSFIDVVCSSVANEHVLTDHPNVGGLPNLPGFRSHYHDQAVLTIVARNYGVPFFPDPSQFGLRAPRPTQQPSADGIERPAVPYGQIFDVHRKKNWDLWYWRLRHLFQPWGGTKVASARAEER